MFKKSLSLIAGVLLLSISAFPALAVDTPLLKVTSYHSAPILSTATAIPKVGGLQADISALDASASIIDTGTEVTGPVAAPHPEPGVASYKSHIADTTALMAHTGVSGSMTDNLGAEALGGAALLGSSTSGQGIH